MLTKCLAENRSCQISRYIPNYICSSCAIEKGAQWPEGHVATFHEDTCLFCTNVAALAHISDWNWPKDHYIGEFAIGREL